MTEQSPLRCYRVWFASGGSVSSSALVDATSEQAARQHIAEKTLTGLYHGEITKVECLDDPETLDPFSW